MTQSALAKLLQMPVDKLRRTTKEELAELGWLKVGKGKGCHYRRAHGAAKKEKQTDNFFEEMKRIEARAKLADAAAKELKNEDIKRTLIIKSAEIFQEAFISSFDSYAKKLYKLDIKKEDRDKLQKKFNECQKSFTQELETRLQELYKPF